MTAQMQTATIEELNELADQYVASERQTAGTGTRLAWQTGQAVRERLIVRMTDAAAELALTSEQTAGQIVEQALVGADWRALAAQRCPTHTFVSMRECGCAHRAALQDGYPHADELR